MKEHIRVLQTSHHGLNSIYHSENSSNTGWVYEDTHSWMTKLHIMVK